MNKTILRCAAVTAIALLAACADDSPHSVASDNKALNKDDAAISRDDQVLAKDRAAKAADKASGNWAGQAVDSISLGIDHMQRSEKEGEASTDQNIKNSDTSR